MANPHPGSLLVLFFQWPFFTSCLVTIWYFLTIFQNFYHYYIYYGDLWSVLFDVMIVIILGHHTLLPYNTASLIDNCCMCLTPQPTSHFPYNSLFLGLSIPWDTVMLKLGHLITLQWLQSVQVKGSINSAANLVVLRNCHILPNIQQPPPWSVSSYQHQAVSKTLHQQKLSCWLALFFSNKVIFKWRHVHCFFVWT